VGGLLTWCTAVAKRLSSPPDAQRDGEDAMSGTDRGFSKIEREHIEQACQHLVANGASGKAAGAYFVLYKGQELPAKGVIREAFRFANQREIDARKFSGGQFVARILTRVGFEVVVHGATDAGGE
jgi:hypothetical protein